jgi:hypothetical protein
MKIIAHTPHGVFESKESEYSDEGFEALERFLERIANLTYFSFELEDDQSIYMTKAMIDQSVFILQK